MVMALEDTPLGYGANDATKSMDDGTGGGEAAREGGGLAKTTTATTTLQLGGLWHLFSIYNKQVLKVFPFPMNITMVQYAVGTVIALIMWTTGILERPKLSCAQVAAILPLAIVHTLCNLFTSMSPGKVAVSFTHVSKSNMDPNPFLSVLLSRKIILGQFLIPWIVLCLVQIATAFQSRKVLRGSLGPTNLFSVITLMSFFLLAPVTLLTEGVKVSPAVLQSAVAAILPLAIVHTLCNLFTNMSPVKVVAVSFTHVSKSNMDPNPSPSVLLSRKIILGQFLIPWIVLCLVQIATAFQSRKVLRGSLGSINLFSVITLMSFFLLAPVTFLTEGVKVTPAVLHSLGLNIKQIYTRPNSAA